MTMERISVIKQREHFVDTLDNFEGNYEAENIQEVIVQNVAATDFVNEFSGETNILQFSIHPLCEDIITFGQVINEDMNSRTPTFEELINEDLFFGTSNFPESTNEDKFYHVLRYYHVLIMSCKKRKLLEKIPILKSLIDWLWSVNLPE